MEKLGKRGYFILFKQIIYLCMFVFYDLNLQKDVSQPCTKAQCPSLRAGERTLRSSSQIAYHLLWFGYSGVPYNDFDVLDLQDFCYIQI